MFNSRSTVFTSTIWLFLASAAQAIQISIPSAPASPNIVQPNFLGISMELSFVGEYFGDDTSSIPPTVINYLKSLRARTGSNPLRIRIGGNSMDISNYNRSITSPMIQVIPGSKKKDYQPANYGPVLWEVLNQISSDVGNVSYLIGLSLIDPNSHDIPLLAGDAALKLGNNLDGFLLGNEPDLYTPHGERPAIKNYTTDIYMGEFQDVLDHLTNTSGGNIPNKHDIGGPTICCAWNLNSLLDAGYATKFATDLKYISLQHYPQNICQGTYSFGISGYIQHSSVVTLASWQKSGINTVLKEGKQKLIMSEFNSAACGGIPTVSDSFAVGSLWTTDYALQLASVGYSAAYIHTRERGISYNIFAPPAGHNGGPGPWSTGSPFYGLLATAEALSSNNGSIVVDLDVANSMTDDHATTSGYAIYDGQSHTVQQLVFFNYANNTSGKNSSVSFSLPADTFPPGMRSAVTVKYLVGASLAETKDIGWGGETLSDSTDGNLKPRNASWAPPNSVIDCTKGCTIPVLSPGMALVSGGSKSTVQTLNATTSTDGPDTNSTTSTAKPDATTRASSARELNVNPISIYINSFLAVILLAWSLVC